MIQDPKARRSAEDALAREITALGAQGVAMYTIAPSDVTPKEGETKTRAAVESIGARGVVVMRPVDVNHRAVQTDTPSSNDMYGGYWGGYYGIGWSDPWVDKSPDVRTDLVATVETFVFSLPQNKPSDRHQRNHQSRQRRRVHPPAAADATKSCSGWA